MITRNLFTALLVTSFLFCNKSTGQDSNSLPEIKPPAIADGKQEIALPATIDGLDVGGGGRYLALHFRSLRKIGIFDVNQLKITGYISTPDDSIRFAAGGNKLLMVSGDADVVSRWDLATQKKEMSQTIDLGGSVGNVVLGSASFGPALVSDTQDRTPSVFSVDVETLTSTKQQIENLRRGFGQRANVRVSADGNVIGIWENGVSPSGLQTYIKVADDWVGYYEHQSVGHVVPSPDGRLVYTCSGVFTSRLRRLRDDSQRPRYGRSMSIPALHGPYSLHVSGGVDIRETTKEVVSLRIGADNRVLATVPNLDPVFVTRDERYIRDGFSLDKRLFLIPDAELVLQISRDRTKLIAVRFDVEDSLKNSDVDYLLVDSRPPRAIKAGEQLSHQIKVRSKSGGVTYSLESGPEGMQVSPTGLLTWKTTAKSPSKSNVIVSIGDRSQQQIFQTFELMVDGGSNQFTRIQAAAADTSPPSSINTTPADIKSAVRRIKLPATSDEIVVGGAGRFLLCHLKSLKKIAVVDVSKAKIAAYLSANDDETRIAAGATRALVFSLTQGVVARYRLDNFQRDMTTTVPFGQTVQYVGMGSGSEGPVMLRTCGGNDPLDTCQFHFMDLNTMKPITVTWPNNRHPHAVYRDQNTILASTAGNVFSVQGAGVYSLSGNNVTPLGGRLNSRDFPLPSFDARYFLSAGQLLSASMQPTGDSSANYGMAAPSITGNYFLSFPSAQSIQHQRTRNHGIRAKLSAKLFMFGDSRPLVTIPNLVQLHSDLSPYYFSGLESRVFLIPSAKVIAVRAVTDDRIDLHRFDIDEALESSGVDYLFVDSQAPAHGQSGKAYEYKLSVQSKRGGVKYNLDAGPEGMKINGGGVLTWNVPSGLKESLHKVIVSVSDDSGQSTFHTFSIKLPDVKAKLEAERAAKARVAMQQRIEQQEAAEYEAAKAKQRSQNPPVRTWTDSTGKHTIEGRFMRIVDKKTVIIEIADGETRKIPLNRLSTEDIYEAVKTDLILANEVEANIEESKSPFTK